MKIMAISVILVCIALTFCFWPAKEISYTVMVNYEEIETYYENKSSTIPLSYEVVNSYIKDEVLKEHRQTIIGGIVIQDEIVDVPIQVAHIEVKNVDSIAGSFTVNFNVDKPLAAPLLTKTLQLTPGETGTAECPAYSLGNWSYTIIPSTKTEYTQVEKQRTVIKQRPETHSKVVPFLDYFLHY